MPSTIAKNNTNNTSCSTLVDLTIDDQQKKAGTHLTNFHSPEADLEHKFIETHILLPSDDTPFYDDDDEDECDFHHGPSTLIQQQQQQQQHLYLPDASSSADALPVDRYLRSIPELAESADMLLAHSPRFLSDKTVDSSTKVLNVLQGELGYATPQQWDVIVSDKATTCHILAAYSKSNSSSTPLASLCHVDRVGYEQCIRTMIQQHKAYHHHHSSLDVIDLDLHIVGGFDDVHSSSRELSNYLLHLFATIASEESQSIRITLRTCAISSMNDNGLSCPMARGLAMDVSSGMVYLAKVDSSLAGPALDIRAARLWSNASGQHLSIIVPPPSSNNTTNTNNTLIVEPFTYSPFPDLEKVLRLPDSILLEFTSTSPDVEESDFCHGVRTTLKLLRDTRPMDYFGIDLDSPLVYRQEGEDIQHQWQLCQ